MNEAADGEINELLERIFDKVFVGCIIPMR
jgi:hypothetical protein